MKATLTIEVPDDFKKGQGKGKCQFYEGLEDGDRPFCDWTNKDCNADNCPLEIQYEREQSYCNYITCQGNCLECEFPDYVIEHQKENE